MKYQLKSLGVTLMGVCLFFSCSKQDEHTPTPVNDMAWQLDSEYKEEQKLPLRVIYPRPDAETNASALHRKASAKWAYKTRICIQGGAAPFKFEFLSSPSSATIVGEFTRTIDPATSLTVHSMPDNYATVVWPQPSGTGTFVVKVTDQSGATTNVSWTVQTDESAFVVLDAVNGKDNNSGTWESPLATVPTGLWKNSATDATFADKIAVFKNGTYAIYQSVPNTNIGIDAGIKPRSFIAIEDKVVFDMRKGHIFVNTGDVAFVGMEFRGARTDVADNRIIQVSTKKSNYLFWKLKFSEQTTVGTAGTDNPSCIVFMDDVVYSHNIAVVDSELLPTASVQLICTFSCDGVLVENNKILNVNLPASNGAKGIHGKDDTKNITIRFNKLTGASASGMIVMSNQQNVGMLASNQEVCYNYVTTTTQNWESGPVAWNQSASVTANAANTHCYRNTIVSQAYALSAASWNGGDAVKMSGTAWVASQAFCYYKGYQEILPANVKLTTSDLNADGTINNSTSKRTMYLGKVGFEIASTTLAK